MEYSTVQIEIAVPVSEEGSVFDVGSLYDRFGQLSDGRKARGKRYDLAAVLVLVVLAKLSGEDCPSGIAEWGREREAILCEIPPVGRPRLPSHNTYRRVLREAVEPAELQAVVSQFLTEQPEAGQSVLIAIDGKTLRGSIAVGETRGTHLLAAYLPQEGIVLTQVVVDGKENEISAAPQVLKSIDLRGKIVRGDALLTQRSLSAQIVEAGGEYLVITLLVYTGKNSADEVKQIAMTQTSTCHPIGTGLGLRTVITLRRERHLWTVPQACQAAPSKACRAASAITGTR